VLKLLYLFSYCSWYLWYL